MIVGQAWLRGRFRTSARGPRPLVGKALCAPGQAPPFGGGCLRLSSVSCPRAGLYARVMSGPHRFSAERLVPTSLRAPVDPALPARGRSADQPRHGPRRGRVRPRRRARGAVPEPDIEERRSVVDTATGRRPCLWVAGLPLAVGAAALASRRRAGLCPVGGVLDLGDPRRAPRAVLPRREPQRPAGAARHYAVDPGPAGLRALQPHDRRALGGPGGHPARVRGRRVGHVHPGPTPASPDAARARSACRGRSASACRPDPDGRTHPDRARDARRARPPDLAGGVARGRARGPARPAAGEGAGDRRAAALDRLPGT